MDKPIAVGDLVIPIRLMLCGCEGKIGIPFVVCAIEKADGRGKHYSSSGGCGRQTYEVGTLIAVREDGRTTEMRRLKRIDPDALLDDVPADEKLTA